VWQRRGQLAGGVASHEASPLRLFAGAFVMEARRLDGAVEGLRRVGSAVERGVGKAGRHGGDGVGKTNDEVERADDTVASGKICGKLHPSVRLNF
jgi:hypothetical protein